MQSVLSLARRAAGKLTLVAAAMWLAACDPVTQLTAPRGPAVDRNAPVPVALLVPGGSGQANDEILARNLENAARLAIADLQGVRIDLRVYNTAGQPSQAASVASQAVAEGAEIILGPVYGGEANAVGNAVAGQNVNVLSFSNNTDIAGGNVFVLGPTFQNTADRLVNYADRQGKGRILIVHEQNPGGDAGRRAIEQAIATSGATLAGVESYAFSQNGIIQAMPRISAAARRDGTDAVFMTADTAGALPLLTQLLPENGVEPSETQFIGLTRWDVPQATLSLPGVQGGWFALPDPQLHRQFENRYSAAYGSSPHAIAGLAYDGIAAVGAIAQSRNGVTRAGLTQSSGFAGVNGVFRLRADGTNERGLAVAEIRNNEVVVVDPAPRSFRGAGF